ncbi:hypothetical protein [Epilithonimonas sp.]|uniref:hypothetical protein n=1 Tax=Epilithonimonas sp. TaxID=2894511 RepID=UPI00289D1934|nr:hypothetical protein [Epilithonimonas sp.]
MENLQEKLDFLKNRNKELSKIIFVGFDTDEELDAYRLTISKEREEYFSNLEQIRQLEWDLMTPEQQARDLEVRHQIRLKTGQIKEGE